MILKYHVERSECHPEGVFQLTLMQIPALQGAESLSFRNCSELCVEWGTGADKNI